MGKINNENYIVIQGFMVNDLQLKGNELLIYAIIYGFSQDENQMFTGSLQYLADWTNSTKRGIMKNLNSLIEKDLIEKQTNNEVNKVYCYRTKFTRVVNKVHQGSEQSSPNNIYNNIYNNINNNIKKENIIKEKKFTKPTLNDINNYCLEQGYKINAEYFINYYESNGWKVGRNPMKDWKATVRMWNSRNKTKKSAEEEFLNGEN